MSQQVAAGPRRPRHSVPPGSAEYSRKDKSLGLLCENFVQTYGKTANTTICLDAAAVTLGVERRRIYDVVNVLESVGIVVRLAKNSYSWRGFTQIEQKLDDLSKKAFSDLYGTPDDFRTPTAARRTVRRNSRVKPPAAASAAAPQAPDHTAGGSPGDTQAAAPALQNGINGAPFPGAPSSPTASAPPKKDATEAAGAAMPPSLIAVTTQATAVLSSAPQQQGDVAASSSDTLPPTLAPRSAAGSQPVDAAAKSATDAEPKIEVKVEPCFDGVPSLQTANAAAAASAAAERPGSRKEKSLGVLSQRFVQLFLLAGQTPVSLEQAAVQLLGRSPSDTGPMSGGVDSLSVAAIGGGDPDATKLLKTKVRRLYDIANILTSLHLIEKVHAGTNRKPAFRWLGPKASAQAVGALLRAGYKRPAGIVETGESRAAGAGCARAADAVVGDEKARPPAKRRRLTVSSMGGTTARPRGGGNMAAKHPGTVSPVTDAGMSDPSADGTGFEPELMRRLDDAVRKLPPEYEANWREYIDSVNRMLTLGQLSRDKAEEAVTGLLRRTASMPRASSGASAGAGTCVGAGAGTGAGTGTGERRKTAGAAETANGMLEAAAGAVAAAATAAATVAVAATSPGQLMAAQQLSALAGKPVKVEAEPVATATSAPAAADAPRACRQRDIDAEVAALAALGATKLEVWEAGGRDGEAARPAAPAAPADERSVSMSASASASAAGSAASDESASGGVRTAGSASGPGDAAADKGNHDGDGNGAGDGAPTPWSQEYIESYMKEAHDAGPKYLKAAQAWLQNYRKWENWHRMWVGPVDTAAGGAAAVGGGVDVGAAPGAATVDAGSGSDAIAAANGEAVGGEAGGG